MTEEERKNRNPAPEKMEMNRETLRELHISDLERYKVYILAGKRNAATMNYFGCLASVIYVFRGPRVHLSVFLRERANEPGALEDGEGNKVTIYAYEGPDA
jgi:hypothetical protein